MGLADTEVVAELSVLLWSLVSESELVPEFELYESSPEIRKMKLDFHKLSFVLCNRIRIFLFKDP